MNQELLYKYFKGITSVEEEKMILDWIDASDENRDIFLKERMISFEDLTGLLKK